MADEMQVTLPEGVLRPIIQAQVIAALSGQEQLVTEMVRFVLNQKVRDEPSYDQKPLIEVLSRRLIREAVEASIKEWLSKQRPAIEQEVARQMRGQVKGIASRLVAALTDSAAQQWHLRIGVEFGKD